MTIGKKLYVNFGAILAMVLVLFLINLVAVQREHSAKAAASQALALADATDKVKFQIMQNRLYLSNYLLSGDTREADRMNDGIQILSEKLQSTRALSNSEQERVALDHVHETEQNWAREFALPLVEKRKEVDAGNATVAELQIFYLQKDASSWVRTATEYLDLADKENKKILDDRRKSDGTAATATILVALTSTLIALALGVVIAYSTSKSITEPLRNLMKVAQQIGNAGDLDHAIDIKRSDEIGELARTFGKMVTYLKEMASVSEAIAGGKAKTGGITSLSGYFPRIHKAYLIGEAAPDFASTLADVPHAITGTLDRAVALAAADAAAAGIGEAVVLLSPACASFDQYPNFEVRGAAFRDLVRALPGLAPITATA